MKIIHKYITYSYLAVFIGALFAITFVLSLGGVFKIMDLVTKGVPAGPLATIFLAGLPSAAALGIPLASLISVLLLFGRLSSDGEISAMKSCGISLFSVASRPILVSVVLSLICLHIHNTMAPQAHLSTKNTLASLAKASPIDLIEEGLFMKDFVQGITLFVGKKHDNILKDIRIFDSTDPNFTREIRAKEGTLIVEDGGAVILNLLDVRITPFAKDKPDPAYADEWPLRLNNLSSNRPYEPREDDFSFGELVARINNIGVFYEDRPERPLPVQHMILSVELNKRLSLSFSCIAFVLLGIPLGIKAHRKESSIGIALSLLLVLNLYIFVLIAESLAKQPQYHADIIVWVPVVLSIILGTYLLRRSN